MRLAFLGDLMLGRTVGQAIEERGPEYVWGDTLPLLREADLRIANLECPISDRGTRQQKMFAFRAPPQAVAALEAAGMDFVSLANNHTLDYGRDALSDTIRFLDSAGIAHSGAGMHHEEAALPAFIGRAGLKIGIVSVTDNMPEWAAGPGVPGVNHVPLWSLPERAHRLRLNWFLAPPLDFAAESLAALRWGKITRLVERSLSAAASADLTILSCHWGPNWRTRPLPMFRKLARSALGRGADVIYGHSAHLFHGIELVDGRPALYDTGDFIDDYVVLEAGNDRSFIHLLDLDDESGKVERVTLVPTVISRCQARLAKGENASSACARMEILCRELGTKTRRDGNYIVIELAD